MPMSCSSSHIKVSQLYSVGLTFSSASGLSLPSVSPCSAFKKGINKTLVFYICNNNLATFIFALVDGLCALPSRAHLSSSSSDPCT